VFIFSLINTSNLSLLSDNSLSCEVISYAAQGAAFIQLNANKVSIKGLSKNKEHINSSFMTV
jgi:hypothetical protein